MKKILATFLTVLMLVSCFSLSVFAIQPGGSSGADVYIKLDGDVTDRYSIDVTFGDMTFVYRANAVWDPVKHDYVVVESEDTEWLAESLGGDKIEITNHSSLPISYETTFEKISFSYGELTLSALNGKGRIDRCPLKVAYSEAPSETVTVSLDGVPENLTADKVTLARVVVTVSAEV